MGRFSKMLLEYTAYTVAKKLVGGAMGQGSGDESIAVKGASFVLAKSAVESLYSNISRKRHIGTSGGESITTTYSPESETTYSTDPEDYQFFIRVTFPDDYVCWVGSTHPIKTKQNVEKFFSHWLNKNESAIEKSLRKIKNWERKLRIYPLNDKQKEGITLKIKLAEAKMGHTQYVWNKH